MLLNETLTRLGRELEMSKQKTLWGGPYEQGVTQSLLNKFLFCRERFRLLVIHGLREPRKFDHYIQYGQIWHEAEEAFSGGYDWKKAMRTYVQKITREFPDSTAEITKWYQIAKRQFVSYIKHWENHTDMDGKEPIAQEHEFCHEYVLPSGRVIYLRGKIDAIDWIKGSRRGNSFVYNQENKTKGSSSLDEDKIGGELVLNLQTMLYQLNTCLFGEKTGQFSPEQVKGTRYNVVRRPLSFGCEYFIKQRSGRLVNDPKIKYPRGFKGEKKKIRKGQESDTQFYNRLATHFEEDPSYWFKRWKVEIHKGDMDSFLEKVLHPILEDLCDWWDWIIEDIDNPFRPDDRGIPGGGVHYMMPFGVYNPLAEGRQGSYYDYLMTGSDHSLEVVDELMPELDTAN